MSMTPVVSVCMPVSRPSHMFEQALASVLAQSFEDMEIVITDDSGGDVRATIEAVADERIRYRSNTRVLGLSGNHCRAIEESHGEYVAFLHDDDWWSPTYLSSAVDVLHRQPESGLVITAAEEVSVDGRHIRVRPSLMSHGVQEAPLLRLMDQRFVMMLPSATIWRRSALDCASRPWPDTVNGDIAAFVDPIVAGWGLYHESTPLLSYRVHDDQIGARKNLLHRDGLVRVWSSYRFEDPTAERQRRRLLAQCYLSRASGHLAAGRAVDAREDVQCARDVDASIGLRRRWALSAVSRIPSAVEPLRFAVGIARRLRSAGSSRLTPQR